MRKTLFACLFLPLCSVLTAQQPKPVVHIYRYKHFETVGEAAPAYCDGILLGRFTSSGNYLDVTIPPGSHTFSSDDKKASVTISLEPGKDYYFLLESGGHINGLLAGGAGFRLVSVTPEQGQNDISKLKPLNSKKAVHDIGGPAGAPTQ